MHEPVLSQEFINSYKNKKVPWGFNGLGYIVYLRTYSRWITVNGVERREQWHETIGRCINGAQKIGVGFTKREAEKLFDYMFHLKGNMAGRMLWQLGTATVDKFGANSLLNCWYISIKTLKSFEFLFENLMLGGGVGISVRKEDVHELPKVKKVGKISHQNTKDADFIVPDSREGWVKLLRNILEAYFVTGKGFTYSTILVRGRGERINGFGGTASGPQILIEGMEKICTVLSGREGKKIRSIDALDICNIIGSIVVAGNVRRSAQIALGDPDDYLFLRAKRWDVEPVPNWRAMSNNTIYADDYSHLSPDFWEGYKGNGEPYGLFNLPLSQKVGRLGEEREDNCEGMNPCGEVTLADYESCNLCEIYLNNIESKDELFDVAKLLYKVQKAVSAMNFIHEETNKVVHKNMRLGLGVTGVCQSLPKLEWLDETYKELRKFDKDWSKERGWNPSIKLTTVKPSGTLSLLAGATPGVHPGHSSYFIRRVRMSSSDPIVEQCQSLGFKTEYQLNFDGTPNRETMIVEFPSKFESGTLIAKDMTAVAQLEMVKRLQTIWSDNSVSVTVYYKLEELESIKDWLKKNYKTGVKSVSFLLHQDHGFKQAPYEEVTEEKYKELISKIKPISSVVAGNKDFEIDSRNCESGVCPLK